MQVHYDGAYFNFVHVQFREWCVYFDATNILKLLLSNKFGSSGKNGYFDLATLDRRSFRKLLKRFLFSSSNT